MKKSVMIAAISVALAYGLPAGADDDERLVRFQGGIGVIPVSSGAGMAPTATVVNRNIVRGVQPAGQLWVIADLRAVVKTDGSIKVDGRGLVFGGGNSIGTHTGQSVFATLICEAATPFIQRNTDLAGVPLDPDGDFRIDDVLTPAPSGGCASPVLLIRNAGNQNWFAAGILKP